MTPRGREILSWYGAVSAGTLTNLARLLNRVLMKQGATSLSSLAVMDIHAIATDKKAQTQ
jgi:hypothetical protein